LAKRLHPSINLNSKLKPSTIIVLPLPTDAHSAQVEAVARAALFTGSLNSNGEINCRVRKNRRRDALHGPAIQAPAAPAPAFTQKTRSNIRRKRPNNGGQDIMLNAQRGGAKRRKKRKEAEAAAVATAATMARGDSNGQPDAPIQSDADHTDLTEMNMQEEAMDDSQPYPGMASGSSDSDSDAGDAGNPPILTTPTLAPTTAIHHDETPTNVNELPLPAYKDGSVTVPAFPGSSKAAPGQSYVGRAVYKDFDGKMWSGKVIEFRPAEEEGDDDWWKVKYTDDTKDDNTWAELRDVLVPLPGTQAIVSRTTQASIDATYNECGACKGGHKKHTCATVCTSRKPKMVGCPACHGEKRPHNCGKKIVKQKKKLGCSACRGLKRLHTCPIAERQKKVSPPENQDKEIATNSGAEVQTNIAGDADIGASADTDDAAADVDSDGDADSDAVHAASNGATVATTTAMPGWSKAMSDAVASLMQTKRVNQTELGRLVGHLLGVNGGLKHRKISRWLKEGTKHADYGQGVLQWFTCNGGSLTPANMTQTPVSMTQTKLWSEQGRQKGGNAPRASTQPRAAFAIKHVPARSNCRSGCAVKQPKPRPPILPDPLAAVNSGASDVDDDDTNAYFDDNTNMPRTASPPPPTTAAGSKPQEGGPLFETRTDEPKPKRMRASSPSSYVNARNYGNYSRFVNDPRGTGRKANAEFLCDVTTSVGDGSGAASADIGNNIADAFATATSLIKLIASNDIATGDEILADYGGEYWDADRINHNVAQPSGGGPWEHVVFVDALLTSDEARRSDAAMQLLGPVLVKKLIPLPPVHSLVEVKAVQDSNHPAAGQHMLVAKVPITKGSCITHYTGVVSEEPTGGGYEMAIPHA
jgi:hypothetical protein